MTIKIHPYDCEEKLGIKRILTQKRFQYSKSETQVEEVAICYGINDNEFKMTITDLTEHRQCSKCHNGTEVYDYRLLSLTFGTIGKAEQSYKKMLKLAKILKQAGGRKK